MLFLPTSSNHGVGSRFNFQLRMALSLDKKTHKVKIEEAGNEGLRLTKVNKEK